jgi:PAS domain S-box-containing protein
MATPDPFTNEIDNLRIKLDEALEALEAIRTGGVDALLVYLEDGERVYTLEGADKSYRIMAESINESVATLSDDGIILWANSSLAELLQKPLANILGTSMDIYIARESQVSFEALLNQEPKKKSKIEIDIVNEQGKRVPVLLAVSPFEDQNHSANFCLVLTDLTEQKLNAEIAASERMSNAIIEQAGEAIVVCDRDGKIVRASRAACGLAGRNPLLKAFDEVFSLQFLDRTECGELISIQSVMIGEVIQGKEACMMRGLPESPQEQLYLSVSATQLELPDRGISGYVITMTDLTERKKAEEEIRRYARQLERSNKDLHDFAFIVSHDLKEPLRKIRSFGTKLNADFGDVLSDEGSGCLKRMHNAAVRMEKMISDLLEYSQVSTKTKPFQMVDLNEIAKEVLSDLEMAVVKTSGRVELAHLPVIMADRYQMRQLFSNLLTNALKFHRQDVPPVVKVYARLVENSPQDPPIRYANLFIEDNGIGFNMEHLERIFQPFQRLHGRSEYDGSGIGLSICRKIVERHKGGITASSTPGEGTIFHVSLPLIQGEQFD